MSFPANNTEVTFDGSAVRAACVQRSDYLAMMDPQRIAEHLLWKENLAANNSDILCTPDGNPACLMAVGVVAADRPQLEPLGNYRPQFEAPFSDAKLMFTLANPSEFDRQLGADFDRMVHNLTVLQHLGGKSKAHLYLLTKHRDRMAVRCGFPLFSARSSPYVAEDPTDYTLAHPVADQHKGLLDGVVKTHQINPYCFYDHANRLIEPPYLKQLLVGAVVEVVFNLQHWVIKPRAARLAPVLPSVPRTPPRPESFSTFEYPALPTPPPSQTFNVGSSPSPSAPPPQMGLSPSPSGPAAQQIGVFVGETASSAQLASPLTTTVPTPFTTAMAGTPTYPPSSGPPDMAAQLGTAPPASSNTGPLPPPSHVTPPESIVAGVIPPAAPVPAAVTSPLAGSQSPYPFQPTSSSDQLHMATQVATTPPVRSPLPVGAVGENGVPSVPTGAEPLQGSFSYVTGLTHASRFPTHAAETSWARVNTEAERGSLTDPSTTGVTQGATPVQQGDFSPQENSVDNDGNAVSEVRAGKRKAADDSVTRETRGKKNKV